MEQNSEGEKKTSPQRFYSGIALDISGGGVRFNSEQEAKPGDFITLQIAFLSKEAYQLQKLFAKVLVVIPVANKAGLYEHRVEFISISNDEREAIIRYIFLEERNRRKREVLMK